MSILFRLAPVGASLFILFVNNNYKMLLNALNATIPFIYQSKSVVN